MNKDAFRSAIKLFLVFVSLTVFLFTWLSGQLGDPLNLMLIGIFSSLTLISFFILKLMERREKRKKREQQESTKRPHPIQGTLAQKRSDASFSLREKNSGLTWGVGNIKASNAKRGTKRKFLGK